MRVAMPVWALLGWAGCGDGSKDGDVAVDVLATEDDAVAAAIGIVGGEATTAAAVQEDGFDLWQVYVTMPNSAELEVLLFADSGDLFEVADTVGPFDYDTLDPLPGQLTYAEARDLAFAKVAGEQVAWEVKFDADKYFYEFYVMEVGDQLWEVKLWADSGDVFVTEAVEDVD